MSRFYQLPPVSSLFVEFAKSETICGKPPVRCSLPFVLVIAVYVFDPLGIGVGVGASQVDKPLGGASPHPDAIAGDGIDDKKRVECIAPVDGYRLDSDGLVGVDVKCGKHFGFVFSCVFV